MSLAYAAAPAVAPLDAVPEERLLAPDRAIRAALAIIAGLPALPTRSAALGTCHDRVLAERARADTDIPLRDSAVADGYAFSSDVCRGEGPWRLRLTGRIAVARNLASENAFPCREAVRITAGAAIPQQLDSVVPADAVQRDGEYIMIAACPERHEGIRLRGDGARCGDVIAQPDRLLDTRDIATLATAGCNNVKVRRTLRVAVLSGSNGKPEGAGAATRAMLMASLDRRWINRQDLGAISGGALATTLRTASEETDIVVAIERPGMIEAIEAAGGRIALGGIAMQPGGTIKLAVLGDMALILLPDEPVAAMTAMAVLGWPLLRRRVGIQHSRAAPRAGIAAFSLAAAPGLANYPLIRVAGAGATPTLDVLSGEAPGADPLGSITRLSLADGIALLTPGEDVRFGSRVVWVPITDRFT